MPLLRRPLRPNLRPLLLTDITPEGESEPLSPLSSVSSSSTSSPSVSRPTSRVRSPHHLPPLGEETERSHDPSLVTPYQSERLTTIDRLTTAVNSLALVAIEATPTEMPSQEKVLRQAKKKRLLEPLKTREYSQFSALRQPVPPSQIKTLNKTPKFKGPPALPGRRTRIFHDPKASYAQLTDDEAYIPINDFTFNDFLLHSARTNSHPYEDCTLERAILSRYTYKQICEMIVERIWAERNESGKIHIQTLVPNIQPFQNRVPMHQIVTEMAVILRQHMSHILGSQLKMNIRALPSWRQKEGAHTEILLYETGEKREEPQNDAKSVSKESNNSLNVQRDTAAEIAILDSLIRNGTHLDLRAFTLEYLPDISLMFTTLVAADLSYNCLRIVPREIFQCAKLEHLYLRHNPIANISSEMNQLKNLVFLDLAFCQLHGTLPNSLFGLTNLRHLDVSYNCLTHIPNEISHLKNLRQLVCDGNEITYLPASIISMDNLRLITAKNTWLLPQFAQDESSTNPLKLLELLAVRASKYPWRRFAHKIPDSSKALLSNVRACDSCTGFRVGNGFRTIITCQNLFGIKFLPILFISCTPHCLRKLLFNDTNRSFNPSTESILINDQIISKLKMRLV